VSLIGNTTTDKGLRIKASLDRQRYDNGHSVSDHQLGGVLLSPHRFHGDWNYTVSPT
jgi:hypothetical protein